MTSVRFRFVSLCLAVCLLVFLVFLPLALAWQPDHGALQLGLATLLGFAGALLGRAAGRVAQKHVPGPEGGVSRVYAAITARLLFTLVSVLVVGLLRIFPTGPFAVWMVLNYVILLGLEVFVSIRELSQNPAQTGRPTAGSAAGTADGEGGP